VPEAIVISLPGYVPGFAMGKSYDEQMDGQYVGTMGSVYKEGPIK
jgi:hypothetical protein